MTDTTLRPVATAYEAREICDLAREHGLESWAGGDKSLYVRLAWRHISRREVGWSDDADPADALLHLRSSTGP